jgi:hypothetical protein
MTDEMFARECAHLKDWFGDISTATGAGGAKLIRIMAANLPKGCAPRRTPTLLVLRGERRPEIYVKPGIKLPNGREPRSTSQVNIEGEAWLQFSYTFQYDPGSHSLAQFTAAALTRFKLAE